MKTVAELIAEEAHRWAAPRARKASPEAPVAAPAPPKLSRARAPRAARRPQKKGTRVVPMPVDETLIREFCHNLLFVTRFNATEAYLKADPRVTRGSAAVSAHRLLQLAKTQAILVEMSKSALERNEVDADYIIGCWIAMSQANVFDYFDQDEKGVMKLKHKDALPVTLQRNVKKLRVTTVAINEMATEQRVELEIVNRAEALHDMATAGGMFVDLGGAENRGDIAKAIEEGFERVRRMQGGKTFDGASGEEIQEGEVVNG